MQKTKDSKEQREDPHPGGERYVEKKQDAATKEQVTASSPRKEKKAKSFNYQFAEGVAGSEASIRVVLEQREGMRCTILTMHHPVPWYQEVQGKLEPRRAVNVCVAEADPLRYHDQREGRQAPEAPRRLKLAPRKPQDGSPQEQQDAPTAPSRH